MKENWMKKLLKLLNEYWKPSCRNKRWEKLDLECADRFYAISKYYEFIKRLVEKDKIDLLKLTCMNPRYTEILDSDFSWEERIIMILSIEENPISFLISILKKWVND